MIWRRIDVKLLIENIRQCIPKNDSSSYSTQLARIDWEDIKFANFTASDCRAKWEEIMQNIRCHRTLSELVTDAELLVDNVKNKVTYTHENQSFEELKPLKPFVLFYMEKRKEILEKKPMSINDEKYLMHQLAKEYRDLPQVVKKRYEDRCLAEFEKVNRIRSPMKQPELNGVVTNSIDLPKVKRAEKQVELMPESVKKSTSPNKKRKKSKKKTREKHGSRTKSKNEDKSKELNCENQPRQAEFQEKYEQFLEESGNDGLDEEDWSLCNFQVVPSKERSAYGFSIAVPRSPWEAAFENQINKLAINKEGSNDVGYSFFVEDCISCLMKVVPARRLSVVNKLWMELPEEEKNSYVAREKSYLQNESTPRSKKKKWKSSVERLTKRAKYSASTSSSSSSNSSSKNSAGSSWDTSDSTDSEFENVISENRNHDTPSTSDVSLSEEFGLGHSESEEMSD